MYENKTCKKKKLRVKYKQKMTKLMTKALALQGVQQGLLAQETHAQPTFPAQVNVAHDAGTK